MNSISGCRQVSLKSAECREHLYATIIVLIINLENAVKDQQPANVETNQHQQLMEAKAPDSFLAVNR